MITDYIVIGSGPSGSMAAQTLCEAGKRVLMLDAGIEPQDNITEPPNQDFIQLRETDPEQYKYFLGNQFETIELENIKTGSQLTPSRKYIIDKVNDIMPVESDTFIPMESLSYGGLGNGWGLGSYVYSEHELQMTGLNVQEMNHAYNAISQRTGISASTSDDTSKYCINGLKNVLPPLKPDISVSKILDSYNKKKLSLNKKGIYMGNISIALLSEDYNNRKKNPLTDMDFYSNPGLSAWRPTVTINELKKQDNFSYKSKVVVLTFKENGNHVEITGKNIDTGETEIFETRKLIIACGAIGSARIVMRSSNSVHNKPQPLLCNPYTYLPCINLKMLGKKPENRKTSMAQAMMFYDKNGNNNDVVSVALYSYQSLLLHKLLKETPLNFADARIIMQYLYSAFVIAGIHHPDEYSSDKHLQLIPADNFTGDVLKASYKQNDYEKLKIKQNEKHICSALRSIGCFPLKKINPGFGSSIHYAGTIPFNNKSHVCYLEQNSRLNNTENVFIADGSGFNYLPAKGITFTLMANAHNVALNSMKN